MKHTLGLLLVALACIAIVYADNFNNVVVQLARYQDTQTGAFRGSGLELPSLQATADALFLTKLYGWGSKINSLYLLDFVANTRTQDNGFSATAGGAADIQSTLNAVLAYKYLDAPIPNPDTVAKYVVSLNDPSTGLFSGQVGAPPSLLASYYAVATLNALGKINTLPATQAKALTALLNKSIKTEGGITRFEFSGVPSVHATFFGLYILESLSATQDINAESIVDFIVAQQQANGGFSSELNNVQADYESTYYALSALDVLERVSKQEGEYLSRPNLEPLYYFARSVPADVRSVSLAHKAVALTNALPELFKFYIEYGAGASKNNKVVQGTALRPELVVRAFGGPSHPGLDASLVLIREDGKTNEIEMVWDNERQRYITADPIPTTGVLGLLRFQYSLKLDVFGVAPIEFTQKNDKYVGFGINVIPTVTHTHTGRSIQPGETISAGTSFEFDVVLFNRTVQNLRSGNFAVQLNVQDSSLATVFTESLDTKSESFRFTYSLDNANYPPGEFTFNFLVLGETGKPHSSESLVYELAVPLVASQIKFDGDYQVPTFHLGDSVKVSFVPAVLPELRPQPLAATNAAGDSIASQRRFYLDISTSNGIVLQTVQGVSSGEQYSFEYTLPATFDFLGASVLSFRYHAASGRDYVLDNYNSADDERFDEAAPLLLTVEADLRAKILEQPKNTNLNYGNEVTFRFQVTDQKTNQALSLGKRGGVFLALNHRDESRDRTYTSARQAAVLDNDEFLISWEVNPNAVHGASTAVLVAEGADGSEVPLLVENTGKPFSSNVNIGGDIKESHQVFSTSDYFTSRTAFVVQFSLACENVPLKNVKLRAIVSRGGELIQTVPVGVQGDKYVASWTTEHTDSPSGDYKVEIFRETDHARASEAEEYKQKQLRTKQREAELSGTAFDEAKFLASFENVSVQPLFEVHIPHKEVRKGGLPLKAEVILGVAAVAGWIYFDIIKGKFANRK